MKLKSVLALSLLMASLSMMTLGLSPFALAVDYGPKSGKLQINIYNDPTTESWALDMGDIDINDWPLDVSFIGPWSDPNSKVALASYYEIGKTQFDINNWRWPTGVPEVFTPETTVKTKVKTATDVGATRIYVDSATGFAIGQEIRIGPNLPIVPYPPSGAGEIRNITNVGADYIDIDADKPLQDMHTVGEDVVVLQNEVNIPATELKSNANLGNTGVYVDDKKYITPCQWIKIGEPGKEEDRYVEFVGRDATGDYFNFTKPLQLAHNLNEPVKCLTWGSWHWRAWMFRRALAHLANKPKYITEYLKGYGYQLETEVPIPALAGWTDYASLTNATAQAEYPGGYIYKFDRNLARELEHYAGFVDIEGDDILNDPKGNWSTGGQFTNLKPLIFYIKIDDPNKRQAAENLAAEMVAMGIPVTKITYEWWFFFRGVMIYHNYHIYTGYWRLTSDIDFIFNLYHSSMSGYDYDNNYAWFRNPEFDYWAEKVKHAPDIESLLFAAINAQWVKAKHVPVIELWAAKGVKGYRKGWEGVVNMEGFGVDNKWSFLRMKWVDGAGTSRYGPPNTIVYGFKLDISAIHVVCSDWLYDLKVIGLTFNGLVGGNPYDHSQDVENALASSWSVDTWDGGTKTRVSFILRPDAKFHGNTTVTADDVKFSLLFTQACGLGVAWNYPMVMNIDHVETSGTDTVIVYFKVLSVFALHWAGFLPIINADLWREADTNPVKGFHWGLDETTHPNGPWSITIPSQVRHYHPWTDDGNNNGIIDLKEDGTGPWKFVSYSVGETIQLEKVYSYYLRQEYLDPFINTSFHFIGNVNYPSGYGETHGWYTTDTKISLIDLDLQAMSSGTNSSMKWGKDWDEYNPDADINHDTYVNILDVYVIGKNYGETAG